jgi:hypothetical protein
MRAAMVVIMIGRKRSRQPSCRPADPAAALAVPRRGHGEPCMVELAAMSEALDSGEGE